MRKEYVFLVYRWVKSFQNSGSIFSQKIQDGLNFDSYDENAAILYTKNNNQIIGTCRLIFDSIKKFPIEEKTSIHNLRNTHKKILEVSRLIIKQEQNGLNLDFKNLTKGAYFILLENKMDLAVSVIKNEHFKLYCKNRSELDTNVGVRPDAKTEFNRTVKRS